MRRILITFSGCVGSGKTSSARRLAAVIHYLGQPVVFLRFRKLHWKWLFRPEPVHLSDILTHLYTKQKHRQLPPGQRRPYFGRLTLSRFLVYGSRILLFRVLIHWHFRRHIIIVDRYFYDSLAHYSMMTPSERLYLLFLRLMLPRPDLAFLMVAGEEALRRRRPSYEPQTLQRLRSRYIALLQEFPELYFIVSDQPELVNLKLLGALLPVVRRKLGREIPMEQLVAIHSQITAKGNVQLAS